MVYRFEIVEYDIGYEFPYLKCEVYNQENFICSFDIEQEHAPPHNIVGYLFNTMDIDANLCRAVMLEFFNRFDYYPIRPITRCTRCTRLYDDDDWEYWNVNLI